MEEMVMSQWQYETIRRCIISGMPAAAMELVNAFDKLVAKYNASQNAKSDVEKPQKSTKEAK